jgi:hypothetical protein
VALRLELIEHVDRFTCAHCGTEYPRVYGNVIEDERQAGVYSADLHENHQSHDRRALLAIGTVGWDEDTQEWQKYSVTLDIWPTATEFQMTLLDAEWSPYEEGQHLGHILDREEALASPLKDTFFHMADHIVVDDPRVHSHLNPTESADA